MKWRKKKLNTENETIDIWVSDDGAYQICQNINHGKVGPNGGPGGWWFQVSRMDSRGHETDVGEAPSLKVAKYVAEDDAEAI